MAARLMVCLGVAALPLAAMATEPNIEPGNWEYTNEITYEGDAPIPDQSHTHTECLTLDDIRQGDAFVDDSDDCQVMDMAVDRDGMSYAMVCEDATGMRMEMQANVRFMGTRMNGRMNADLETPMGPMSMRVEIDGERIGDC